MKTPIEAIVICIGDELLIGQTIDTNSAYIGSRLNEIGIRIKEKYIISDEVSCIQEALHRAMNRASVVIFTGGLGPTSDDKTMRAVADYFGSSLAIHSGVLRSIEDRFASKGRPLNKLNTQQALFPHDASVIWNKYGTAPGVYYHKDGKHIFLLPGVPMEMKAMMGQVLEILKPLQQIHIYHKTISTYGIPESVLAEKLEECEKNLPDTISLAYLPSLYQVKIRLSTVSGSIESAREDVEVQVKKLKEILQDHLYAEDDIPIERVIGEILTRKSQTLACAESCTGGYLSHLITSVPGSSFYFKGGVVSYANEVKIKALGVREEDLQQYGAVSEQVVKQMAEGVRKRFDTDYALATSGVAGPSGGSEDKPVGTVWIAVADRFQVMARKWTLSQWREVNIEVAARQALFALWQQIK